MTQVDSAITGHLFFNNKSYDLKGTVSYTRSVIFESIPPKLLSPFWVGVLMKDNISGDMIISTGGRAEPLVDAKFTATKIHV